MKSAIRSFTIIAAIYLCNSQLLIAQWSSNPNVNNAICTMANDQTIPAMVSDGSGGAIITWKDYRSGSNSDIYAQRISADGIVQWTPGGVAICTATGFQGDQVMVSDGSGGAIIAWDDYRSGTYVIYAQRINADSTVQWNADGVALCNSTGSASFPSITSDGKGGAIVVWEDNRVGRSDIYAQRISSDGTVKWDMDGVPLCAISGNQSSPTSLISDGKGGAIDIWQDARNQSDIDLYTQRIDSNGTVQWTTDGVALCTMFGDQIYTAAISDGNGGALVAWQDWRSGEWNIYAQRINADSTMQWTVNGAAICLAASHQSTPSITSDGNGGAIIAWHDNRNGNIDIYAQRINADSTVRWTPDGIAVCTVAGGQAYPKLVSDGSGGAVVLWWDYSNGADANLFAQRIGADSVLQWSTNGVAICTAAGYQGDHVMISDGNGGAIIGWDDQRDGNNDIYMQRVYSTGNLYTSVKEISGIVPNKFTLCQNYPNPFNPSTTIEIGLPVRSRVILRVYNILGQEVALLINGRELPEGSKQVYWKADLPSGVYMYRMEAVSISNPGERFIEAKKMLLVK